MQNTYYLLMFVHGMVHVTDQKYLRDYQENYCSGCKLILVTLEIRLPIDTPLDDKKSIKN